MPRPNILILYTDQQRWDTLGCVGNREIYTPSLNELAAEGTVFDRHFVQHPLCMPSRVSRLTGLYPGTLGITHMGVPVPEDVKTLPDYLRPYGYRSANFGKLHFIPHANRDHRAPHPMYGFDQLEVSDEPGVYEDAYRAWVRQRAPEQLDRISVGIPPAARTWYDTMGLTDSIQHPGGDEARDDFVGAIPFPAQDTLTHTAFVAARTKDFIQEQHQNPFLCIAGFYSPHAPWVVPQRYLDLYDAEDLSLPEFPPELDSKRPTSPNEKFSDAQLRDAKRGYYAMISEVDEYVGQIIQVLKDTDQYANTIIVFTSDHGEWLGDHLRYGKGYPGDDAVTRVPLIIRAPELQSGNITSQIVESVDLLPTLLDLSGIQIPQQLQGESLLPILQGNPGRYSKNVAFVESNGWKSLRNGQYRYLLHKDGSEALWDLQDDPGEYHDLANDPHNQTILATCRHQMLQHIIKIERPLPRTWPY